MSLFGWEEQEQIKKTRAALKSWQDGYTELKPQYDALVIEVTSLRARVAELYKGNSEYHQAGLLLKEANKNQKGTIDDLTKQKKDLETELHNQLSGQSAAINSAIEDTRQQYIRTIEQQRAEIEELNRVLDANRTEIALLTRNIEWVKLAEVNCETGYRGILPDGGVYESTIIRVKNQHLKEIPVSIEEGDEVYEDGTHYPIQLLDFIRTGSISRPTPKGNVIDVRVSDVNNKKEDRTEDENTLNLTPNEKKVMEYIAQNPGVFHKDIADGLAIDKSNLSKVLKGLEERGLIEQGNEGGYSVV